MTGKVFSESSNIYQDQAKVLFDYYKSAAEKIVSEEEKSEAKIADLKKQIEEAEATISKKKTILIITAIAAAVSIALCFLVHPVLGIAGVVASGVFAFLAFRDCKNAGNVSQKCNEMLAEAEKEYKDIRRDYSVDKIGVVYVPVATRVPFENKSFMIDHTNTVDNKDFKLTLLNNPEEFQKSVQKLEESMEKMPIIDSNEMPENINTSEYSLSIQNMTLHDYAGNIDRQVRNISYLLNDSRDVSVEIPVIVPGSKESQFIHDFATTDIGDNKVVNVFDTSIEDALSRFTALNDSKDQINTDDDTDNTDYFKQLMTQLADSVQIMSKTKNAGASNLNNYTSAIFGLVLKAGYNQYSPSLEADEIERIRTSDFDYRTSVNEYEPFNMKKSSSVKYDLFTANWIADDGSRTAMPFGMHQVDEEVLQPVIAMLMEENRVERLKIYNNIEDQKRMYLDRWSSEIGNYFRDNRQAADELINRMRDTYADYCNAYNMYKSLDETIKSMESSNSLDKTEVNAQDSEAEMIAGFEEQAKNFNKQQEEFGEYLDRIMDDINNTTKEFSHIEYYEGSLRDSVSHDTAVAMASINLLDSRKKQLLGVSPYIANYGELPPQPMTTDEMMEHVCIDLNEQVKSQIEQIDSIEAASSDIEHEDVIQ